MSKSSLKVKITAFLIFSIVVIYLVEDYLKVGTIVVNVFTNIVTAILCRSYRKKKETFLLSAKSSS
jgi:hypothetical protein